MKALSAFLFLLLSFTLEAQTPPTYADVQKIPNRVAAAQANLCANPSAVAATAASTQGKPAKNCPDADKTKTGIASAVAAAKQTAVARDLAFFDAYKKLHSYDENSVDYLQNRITQLEERLATYKTRLAERTKAIELFKGPAAAFVADGTVKSLSSIPSDSMILLIGKFTGALETLRSRIESRENRIKEYQAELAKLKSSSERKEYQDAIKQLTTALETNKSELAKAELPVKCLTAMSPVNCNPESLQALRDKIKSEADQAVLMLDDLKSSIGTYQKSVDEMKLKLAARKAEDAAKAAGAPTESDEVRLKKYEEQYKDEVAAMALIQGHQVCGTSVAERVAINYYTGSGYSPINKALRTGGDALTRMQPIIDVLNAGLLKLKAFDGYVVRGASLPASVKAEHAVGSTVTYAAFTSTSLTVGFGTEDRFVIHSRTGRYIGSYSSHYGEDEVLFASGTKFKVLAVKAEGSMTTYTLDEVAP